MASLGLSVALEVKSRPVAGLRDGRPGSRRPKLTSDRVGPEPEAVLPVSRAEAIRVYTQKDMGREAELSAAEIVRRAERRIGELVRAGQEEGTVRTRGSERPRPDAAGGIHPGRKISPTDFFTGGQETTDTYAMTEGDTKPAPGLRENPLLHKHRRLDPNRIVGQVVAA